MSRPGGCGSGGGSVAERAHVQVRLWGDNLPPSLQEPRSVSFTFDHARLALVSADQPQWHYQKKRWYHFGRSAVTVIGCMVVRDGTPLGDSPLAVPKHLYPGDTFTLTDLEVSFGARA